MLLKSIQFQFSKNPTIIQRCLTNMQKVRNQKGGKYLFTALYPDSSSPSSPSCALQDRHTQFSKEKKQVCFSLDLNLNKDSRQTGPHVMATQAG